jgi:hypothetical protein
MVCEIETTSMAEKRLKEHPEKARFWQGPEGDGRWICEHMLEMD